MKRIVPLLLAALVLIGGCSLVSHGNGDVVGICQARDGSLLPGVTVTLIDASGQSHIAITDGTGKYRFTDLPPGRSTITWSLSGYGSAMRSFRVAAGKAAVVQGTIGPAVSESITVTSEAPLIDKRKANEWHVDGVAIPSLEKVPAARDPWTIVQNVTAAPQVTPNVLPGTPASYTHFTENGFMSVAKEGTTTFSIDVDKASYANVRRFLHDGLVPPPDAVRIEEMVNYFTYHYPQPADDRPFSISSEVAGCPWNPAHRLLRIGLQAKSTEAWRLAPNNLVFLLDVSGSMYPPERLPLIKSALHLLLDQLRGQDSVAIVVYAGAAGVVLPPTPGSQKDKILAALDNLQAGGSTAGGAGIRLAYKVAKDNFLRDGNNRVILATDGDFNVGVSSFDDLTKLIEEQRNRNIYLTCLGVGSDNLQDGKIQLLADKGNGNYFYLDSMAEAKKVFERELAGTLVTVADDMKVQLTFDPAAVASYRQIGYEKRAMANQDFADDTKDAGELGSGHSVTVLYELEPLRATGNVATLKIRYKDPGATASKEVVAAINDEGKSAYDASPDTQFAAAVAEFGMLLRGSMHKGSASWADVTALARAVRGEDLEGYREELLQMVSASTSARK